jgi:hypothetical protein
MEGDNAFKTLKTYFDGSFKFTPNKNQQYTISITYPGFTDTTYRINTDKNGKPDTNNITVYLRKDGMRLLGTIKNKEDNFPIDQVTIILKNVMTRQETRITTGIEGYYNFRLQYETNYRVSIDKNSPGIYKQFRDSTFYVSTVGFNMPLDYKLDIALEPLPDRVIAPRPYNAKGPSNTPTTAEKPKNNKPAAKDEKLKSYQDKISQLQAELEKTKKQLQEKPKDGTTKSTTAKKILCRLW